MKAKQRLQLIGLPVLAMALATVTATAGAEETAVQAPAADQGCFDWLEIGGYGALAYTFTDNGTETFADGNTPLDALKVGFKGAKGPIGGYASLFYTPNVPGEDGGILDAYLNYTVNNFTLTAGKYLSYLGFEAFDAINMHQLTYATRMGGAIPAYRSGVKLDYLSEVFDAGFSFSDSIMRDPNEFWAGDGEFSDDQGYEGYIRYKGIDKLTVFLGAGYENTDPGPDWSTVDLWASYELTDKLTVAGEITYHERAVVEGLQGLLFAKYAFTDKLSTVARFGMANRTGNGPDDYSYTICPTYAFCENFMLRAELTYTDSAPDQDTVFTGIQALAKF